MGAACRNLEARLEKVKVCSLFTVCGSSVDQGQVRFTVHWQVHCGHSPTAGNSFMSHKLLLISMLYVALNHGDGAGA